MTCQVCGRAIKSTTGLVAHHGYQRPYQAGWQTASCRGARYAPYEESCERLREVASQLFDFILTQEKALVAFLSEPPQTITVYKSRSSWSKPEQTEYTRPDGFKADSYRSSIPRTYENAFDDRKREYERTIRMAKADLVYMEQRLNEWKPQSK